MSDFFEQLAEFSRRYLQAVVVESPSVSPFSGPRFADTQPSGVVVHYTADEDVERVLRWFLVERFQSQVSAHTVIARAWPEGALQYAKGLPLIEALPTMVVQVVPPTRRAWHARRRVNDDFYGIELINAGELRSRNGGFFSWRDSWGESWDDELGAPVPLNGRWWAPYTRAQVEACAEVLLWGFEDAGRSISYWWIMGHECVQENKRDPGPAFPIDLLRGYCLDRGTADIVELLDTFENSPFLAMDAREEAILLGAFWSTFGREPTRVHISPDRDEHRLWWAEMAQEGSVSEATFTAMMQLMGYGEATPGTIKIFQRMVGLDVDGIPGPLTRGAVLARARDRGIV